MVSVSVYRQLIEQRANMPKSLSSIILNANTENQVCLQFSAQRNLADQVHVKFTLFDHVTTMWKILHMQTFDFDPETVSWRSAVAKLYQVNTKFHPTWVSLYFTRHIQLATIQSMKFSSISLLIIFSLDMLLILLK